MHEETWRIVLALLVKRIVHKDEEQPYSAFSTAYKHQHI